MSIDEDGIETRRFFRQSESRFVPRYIEARGRAFRVRYTSTDGSRVIVNSGFALRYYALYEGSGCPDTALPLTENWGNFQHVESWGPTSAGLRLARSACQCHSPVTNAECGPSNFEHEDASWV